jgi:hypothetical protein
MSFCQIGLLRLLNAARPMCSTDPLDAGFFHP